MEYLADSEDEEFVTNFFPVFENNIKNNNKNNNKNKSKKKRKNSYDVTYRLNLFDLIIDKFEKAAISLVFFFF